MILTVKNWADFQHYKDRSPPWIKLHKGLLDNYEYQCLPIASRALAPMIWLLASESVDGSVDADIPKLAFRLRVTEKEVQAGLTPLIDKGFFIADSDVLADCKRDAMPETEESRDREESLSGKPDVVVLANGKQKFKGDSEIILAFLNEKAGKRFEPVRANLDFIASRLKEGASISDCRAVIALKCREWKGTDSAQYLRPATLFNATKFAQYVGELSTGEAQ